MEYKTLEIPILIVEYDKINLLQDDQPPRSETHREHLKGTVAAALPMHSVLDLKTPLYGVFLDLSKTGEFWAGSIAEVEGVTRPVMDRVGIRKKRYLNFRLRRLDILHLQNIIANLGGSASSVLDEISNDTSVGLRPNVCPVDETFRCAADRQVDTKRLPVVVDDETLQYLFSINLEDVARWLSEAEITVADTVTLEPPEEIQNWVHLFGEPEGLPDAWIRKAVVDGLKGLSHRARDLASEFLSKYRYASTSSSTPLPDSLKVVLDYNTFMTHLKTGSILIQLPLIGR
ncbi:hypothetical protein CPB85DRAFT_1254577 [Mucidula mucida]|nr:hypothetical protein CPB85DRAFT_1254577 [Mucidula mucida]